jgi:hypothetical protein
VNCEYFASYGIEFIFAKTLVTVYRYGNGTNQKPYVSITSKELAVEDNPAFSNLEKDAGICATLPRMRRASSTPRSI